jgi:tetratricopeptide (TPR) repeat protein
MTNKLIILLTLFAIGGSAAAQSFDFQLKLADSLFQQKKFTESLKVYEEIYQQNAYSPAMLLKMAYVEEGLGHKARSLFYLDTYYQLTRDDRALEKMEETANAFQLRGYDITPFDRFLMFLTVWRIPLIAFLAAGTLIFALSGWFSKERSLAGFIVVVQFFFAAALLFLINLDLKQDTGIVSRAPLYIMSGPSSGADVVAVIGDGHKLDIDDREDVWVKVKWGGKEGWVKESGIMP